MYRIMTVIQMCAMSKEDKRRLIREVSAACTGKRVNQWQTKKALMLVITEERQSGNGRLLEGDQNGDLDYDDNGDGNHSCDIMMDENEQAHRDVN